MKKVLLKIDGMTCSACSTGLEKYLNKQDGIKQATVNLIMNNANIEYDEKKLTLEQVEKFVEKAGFESLGIDNFEKEEKRKTNEKYKLIAITIISILVLYISVFKHDDTSNKLCNITIYFNNNSIDFRKRHNKKWIQKLNTQNTQYGHTSNDRSFSKLYLQYIWNNSNFKKSHNVCRKLIF